jgi:hypothetical protein
MAAWQAPKRLSRGGQAHYSDIAIEKNLLLLSAFRIPLRQAQGLVASVFELSGITLEVPDYTTVSRRSAKLPSISLGRLPKGPLHVLIDSTGLKVYGAGQWLEEKHGQRSRRCWRKLHLAVDANTNLIVACVLTEQDMDTPPRSGHCSIRFRQILRLTKSQRAVPTMESPLTKRYWHARATLQWSSRPERVQY